MAITSGRTVPETEREERKRRFLSLLEPVYPRFERFALAMTRDVEEGRDLVGETVLKAFEHFDSLRDEKAFLAYLFSIASRLHRRREQRALRFDLFDSESAEAIHSADPQPDLATDINLLGAALAHLPLKQREAIVLHEIAGLQLKEIREIQGGTITALKVRLWRGRRELARLMGVEAQDNASNNASEQRPTDDSPSSFPADLQRALS